MATAVAVEWEREEKLACLFVQLPSGLVRFLVNSLVTAAQLHSVNARNRRRVTTGSVYKSTACLLACRTSQESPAHSSRLLATQSIAGPVLVGVSLVCEESASPIAVVIRHQSSSVSCSSTAIALVIRRQPPSPSPVAAARRAGETAGTRRTINARLAGFEDKTNNGRDRPCRTDGRRTGRTMDAKRVKKKKEKRKDRTRPDLI